MAEPELSLVDSHCHIDMPEFDRDRDHVMSRAKAAGVESVLVVGGVDEAQGHRRALRVAADLGVPASAGIHPHEARLATETIYEELRGWGRERRIVAIGEVGLDFHYDHSPRPTQMEVFRYQVNLARQVGLPLIIHTREADSETATILETEGAREVGGVIHCFTGGPELADRALALGFFVSFSGIVTFPKAEGLRAVARRVPADRILIETDSPFLAPVPQRGHRNEPAYVVHVAETLALIRGETVEKLGAQVLANYRKLFRIS